jgi:hypothetical protein
MQFLQNFKELYVIFRDGQLKRMKAKPEWKEKQQEEFSKRLKVDTKKQE